MVMRLPKPNPGFDVEDHPRPSRYPLVRKLAKLG
jgi:hypothetical protein